MKPLAIIISTAFCVFGTSCLFAPPDTDLRVFDYSSEKAVASIPAPGYYREILCKNVVSGCMPKIDSAFFTMAQDGEYPNARLILRKRDQTGGEVSRYQLPLFDSVFHAKGVYSLSSDAKRITYWEGEKRLHVRELASGKDRVVFTLPSKELSVEEMAWPESGRIIFAIIDVESTSVTIHVLGQDGASRQRTFTDLGYSYPGLSVSPDGKWIWCERKFKAAAGSTDSQIVLISTDTLEVAHVVPSVKVPQQVGHGVWSDDSKSFGFMLWSELAATKKPADFYHYRLADKSLKHITTGIGSDACIAIANGEIQILKNHNSVHVFSERDGSPIRVLKAPVAGFLNRIPGTTRWVY